MFEKLFVKTSDIVYHTIAPYAVERERFLLHCGEEGFSKAALRRIAGIVVNAACDLHAHGGLSLETTNICAEVDLAMKAKALSECSIPDAARRHWRKEPGLMAFLRSL